jgi:hypothetical protein
MRLIGVEGNMKSSALMILFLALIVSIVGCRANDDNSAVPSAKGLRNPAFSYISSNWRDRPYKIRMDDIWQDEGIDAQGQNYYFFPRPTQGHKHSERFNPQSDYFQAWFGIYTIENTNDTIYALSDDGIDAQAIIELAIADQRAWLRTLGLSQPSAELDDSVPLNVSQIEIDGRSGWKIAGTLNTNADVGLNNPRSGLPALLIAPSAAWQENIESYGFVKQEAVFYVWYAPENKELNVVYYTGVEFDDVSNSHHRTLSLISAELESMALSVTVRK